MRLELQERTDRAIRVLRTLGASPDAWTKSRDLAVAAGTTPAFLAQVVRPLVRRGWVVSAPGSRGGYRAAPGLDAVSVLDVVEAIEGPTSDDRCVLRHGTCRPEHPCALHEPWTRARTALLAELAAAPVLEATTGSPPVPSPSTEAGAP